MWSAGGMNTSLHAVAAQDPSASSARAAHVQALASVPLLIEFVSSSWIRTIEKAPDAFFGSEHVEKETIVEFSNGLRVSVPADQVVLGDDQTGAARIGLGGMTFEGVEDEQLVFFRVRDLLPEDQLAPSRSDKFVLPPACVSSVTVQGAQVWPRA
jgi:hypothetical protein